MGNSNSRAISSGDKSKTVPTPVESAAYTTAFKTLPKEMVLKIGERLSLKDKARLSRTSKYYHGLFQPDLRAARLLSLVVRGEQGAADGMLSLYPALLLKASDVTDYSGRTFHCTAHEYAYWAKDTHMCRMLERHMDDTAKAQMLARVDEIERIDKTTNQPVGLAYRQYGAEHRSAHFDLTRLKTALQRYVDRYHAGFFGRDWLAMKQLGMAQRDVPAHVAQEYCREDRSFHPCPPFNEPTLPRKFIASNWEILRFYYWFPIIPGLGSEYVFIRGQERDCHACDTISAAVVYDLAAITYLDKVRTADLTLLREHLNHPIMSHGMSM